LKKPRSIGISFASSTLPSADVIVLPTAKRNASGRGAFTKVSIGKMHCPAGKQEALFWDPNFRGFGLRALASGRRTWIYQYRDESKRTRRIALGDVSAVSLDAARLAARQRAARVARWRNCSSIAPRRGWQVCETQWSVMQDLEREMSASLGPKAFGEFMNALRELASLDAKSPRLPE
jgi:hypothetical protein